MVVIVVVEHAGPAIAAAQGMVAVAAYKASRCSWHCLIVAAIDLAGKQILPGPGLTGVQLVLGWEIRGRRSRFVE